MCEKYQEIWTYTTGAQGQCGVTNEKGPNFPPPPKKCPLSHLSDKFLLPICWCCVKKIQKYESMKAHRMDVVLRGLLPLQEESDNMDLTL